ncbi:hypothetical protein VD0002_g3531 [Verticillium dahliae]|uniref:Glycosyltransferase family 31 protein n=2 Tax=Verticillium dahliae TaxID=27337 RepID=G2WXH8_VERDV|nr:uncharacterized protein VDAG_02957 [Verticillium dahliae VdLs.17]KAF3351405.1 3-hydroxybenzoate 6-hydroxylase 1 [Verticillium dahliae VDG2]PNH30364.1 hypothetical protein BJF96_g6464 [Verticillium dahliae]EGY21433.1 hypothetical protein VDAG_02957 [Verticillium dahliae VdLs.17]PNH43420.1 hypothetical protein VD0004_g4037 [Verticillium dahliae]PNH53551.1 hypothetical protein VD0003_g3868 [Verticillium dahliae]
MKLRIPQTRTVRSLASAVGVTIFVYLLISNLETRLRLGDDGLASHPSRAGSSPARNPDCPGPALRHLRNLELNLTDTITYTKRCIKPVVTRSLDRDAVAQIDEPLLKIKTKIDLSSCAPVQLERCDPIPLRVPRPYPKSTYPQYVFGVATSYERYEESIDTFAFWLAGSHAKLVGVVTDYDENRPNLEALVARYAERDVIASFVKPIRSRLSVGQNHFTIIRDLVKASGPETEWIAILDDDTFFPSLHKLTVALSDIDHTQQAYVGALSEDFRAVRTFGYMAFGGGGVFLSAKLARDLEPLLETCLNEAKTGEGDALVRECVYKHTHTKLTPLPGLHQMDMARDATGFYEGGPSPLSVHHWKSWYFSPVELMATITHVCGDCFLQRWRMGADTVLTNGYSISIYRDGLDDVDLSRMEDTWSNEQPDFYDFSIGPLRKPMKPGQKKTYKLEDADYLKNGGVRQIYVHRAEKAGQNDDVIELSWEASRPGLLGNIRPE